MASCGYLMWATDAGWMERGFLFFLSFLCSRFLYFLSLSCLFLFLLLLLLPILFLFLSRLRFLTLVSADIGLGSE